MNILIPTAASKVNLRIDGIDSKTANSNVSYAQFVEAKVWSFNITLFALMVIR